MRLHGVTISCVIAFFQPGSCLLKDELPRGHETLSVSQHKDTSTKDAAIHVTKTAVGKDALTHLDLRLRYESPTVEEEDEHPLWRPEWGWLKDWKVYLCMVCLFFAGILCSAGGLGGGGVYVTVLMIAGGMTVRDSVPLSGAVVFSGSLSTLACNLIKMRLNASAAREGAAQQPSLIDYDICRLIVPSVLAGSCIGVALNAALPASVTLVLLIALLLFILFTSARTTYKQYLEETKVVEIVSARVSARQSPKQSPKLNTERGGVYVASGMTTGRSLPNSGRSPLNSGRGGPRTPRSLYMLTPRSLMEKVGGDAAKKSSSQAPSGAATGKLDTGRMSDYTSRSKQVELLGSCRSKGTRETIFRLDIVVGFLALLVVIVCGALGQHMKLCRHDRDECWHPLFHIVGYNVEYILHSRDAGLVMGFTSAIPYIVTLPAAASSAWRCNKNGWPLKQALLFSFAGLMTGVLAGVVGVGGGLIFSPFFLWMELEPAVAVATSSTCVIFTSASTAGQYLLTDRIVISLCIVYGVVNLAASYYGTKFVHYLQDRFGARKSFISGIVSLGVVLSVVLSFVKLAT